MINKAEIQRGDVFSESSHYVCIDPQALTFKHLESNQVVTLGESYVTNLLSTADQYSEEKKVGREDKLWTSKQIEDAVKKGDLAKDHEVRPGDVRVMGIRTIFENIYTTEVFTVCFKKQNTPLSSKKYQEKIDKVVKDAVSEIKLVQAAKKGVAKTAEQIIEDIIKNPILPYEEGEERILRGYKIQFESRDGRYNCVDMDITEENNNRPVNINTLLWIVIGGTKYVVE